MEMLPETPPPEKTPSTYLIRIFPLMQSLPEILPPEKTLNTRYSALQL
jgi:hypothetical protein